MEPLANTLLIVEGVVLLLLAYKCSWAANAAPEDIPAGRYASYVRLRRVFWVGMPLAILCFLVVGVHVVLRNAFMLGTPISVAAFAFAAAMPLFMIWFAVEIRLDRKGYRLS